MSQIVYGIHPAVSHLRAIAANLPTKTGRPLADWVQLVEAQAPPDTKGRMAWLKAEHGLGRDTAMAIVEFAEGRDAYEPQAYVDAMFAGPKAPLLPLYERLVQLGAALGPDVMVVPCSTYIPLMRKRQFMVVKPTTRTRLDLGLALPDTPHEGRLEPAKNLGSDRITHRIGISSMADIDADVERWLRAAYEADAT